VTQPDRPAGRGQHLVPSAVKRFASQAGLPVYQPESLRGPEVAERLREVRADVLIVAAYGALLPPALLEIGRFGALNIHASLLPRWRGAAPIQRALLAGDPETGVSIMQMDAGLDTGAVLARRKIGIAPDDDAGTLHDKLASLGAELMVATLAQLGAGELRPVPQSDAGVTYAGKITRADTVLDWSRPALELERIIRAFRPAPGAAALLRGESLKIWKARIMKEQGVPGAVLRADESSMLVACGHDALEIAELQRPGARRMSAADFLRGRPVAVGSRFE
jgi:methionyl-tRNA formyltransferase